MSEALKGKNGPEGILLSVLDTLLDDGFILFDVLSHLSACCGMKKQFKVAVKILCLMSM